MAKTAKGKQGKKKNLKLRRQLRKTFGCLFMISALIVTAIPVTPTEAGPNTSGGWDHSKFWVESAGNAIPTIKDTTNIPIYTDETEKFSFVYVDEDGNWDPKTSKDKKFAIIVDFDRKIALPQGRLTIPAVMDAYVRFSDGDTQGSYAASNRRGRPLYYKDIKSTSTRSVSNVYPELIGVDENGNPVYSDAGVETYADTRAVTTPGFQKYAPCLLAQKDVWSPGGQDVDLFYFTSDQAGLNPANPEREDMMDEGTDLGDGATWQTANGYWKLVRQNDTDRIAGAEVKYIGKQYLDVDGTLHDSDANRSVFGGTGEGQAAGNINSLTFAKKETSEPKEDWTSPVIGIGKYAFYGCTNIKSISLDNGLNTLGNYAFAGCRQMTEVKWDYFTNLSILGACAFQDCESLKQIAIPTNLQSIGDFCFENCVNLELVDMKGTTFGDEKLRYSLRTIGYKAFLNCKALEYLDLPASYNGNNYKGNSQGLDATDKSATYGSGTSAGDPVFHLSTVQGCTSLKHIKTESETLRFVTDASSDEYAVDDSGAMITVGGNPLYLGGYKGNNDTSGGGRIDGGYTFEVFKSEVGDEFYFEAPPFRSGSRDTEKTPVHNIANVNHICFKHLDEDRYEIVEKTVGFDFKKDAGGNIERDENGKPIVDYSKAIDVGLVFAVDSPGQLIGFHVENPTTGAVLGLKVPEVTMPEKIGPYGIESITKESFSDNCWIQKVTIPETVKTIGDESFRGCHDLQHVVFSDASKIEKIGRDAFATQKVGALHGLGGGGGNSTLDCGDNSFLETKEDPDTGEQIIPMPFLSFSGSIEKEEGEDKGKVTEPFRYAMTAASNINAGEQGLSYITYYTGMPTNLTVKYNPEKGGAELQYFPTKDDLTGGFEAPENYVGAYTPVEELVNSITSGKEPNKYRFPYMNVETAAAAGGAFGSGNLTEDQTNMRNGVENIVIPNGVKFIQEKLFSGVDTNGYIGYEDEVDENGKPTGNQIGILPEPTDETGYESPAPDILSLTVKSVTDIEPYTFARIPNLDKAYVSGATSIGNYAFDECTNLTLAEVSADTAKLGLRPFSGCVRLKDMSFPESPYFTAENGVIYGLSEDGNKTKTSIVECLESRGRTPDGVGSMIVGPDEFNGITEISPEAFMDCDNIRTVDLSSSNVREIPEKCFAEANLLNVVRLPGTARVIRDGAFWNTATLAQVVIPYDNMMIATDAFAKVNKKTDGTYETPLKNREEMASFSFVANEGSAADDYAKLYNYIEITQDESLKAIHTVILLDAVDESNPKPYKTLSVRDGDNLELTILDLPDMTDEAHKGYEFDRWSPEPKNINPIGGDYEIWAMFKPIGAITYTVRFHDIEGNVMESYTQQVVEGQAARAPSRDEMEVEGKVFTGWDRDISKITSNLDVYPIYTDRVDGMFYVTFWTDMDMTQMIGKVQEVASGESAIEPAHPTKEGYTFSRWSTDAWQNVTKDLDVFAVYVEGSGNTPGPDDPNNPNNPGGSVSGNGSGNNGGGNGGDDGGGDDGNNNDSASGNSVSGNGTKYKVVVNGGSGSGEYTAGTIVPINAYARADGTVFDKWTSSSNGVGFVNQTAIATTFTMPANNVEINANFKVGSSSSVSSNSRSARRNSTTTVDVSKGGISNTDIASANVNGSSDNFVVKITDDAQATAAVIAALEAKYGDLSNIAYLPMDISLYDATGTTKITDVSGVTVDITLPLPDELIQYAGNNKAAAVANGRLEDLNTRFTTIDGIPCVQFTATHFSPYTIYVDTANLTAGTIDATPKTGDPIHPKWFLAMGLACISIVLFCKKDKQPKVKHA